MKIKFILALSLVVSGLSSVGHGALITSVGALTGLTETNTVVTVPGRVGTSLTNVDLFPNANPGNIDVLGTIATETAFLGRTTSWDLFNNGNWNAGGPNGVAYNGINSNGGIPLSLNLSTAVSGFVFFMNHSRSIGALPVTLTAKDSGAQCSRRTRSRSTPPSA
jgi:hypothetical protein